MARVPVETAGPCRGGHPEKDDPAQDRSPGKARFHRSRRAAGRKAEFTGCGSAHGSVGRGGRGGPSEEKHARGGWAMPGEMPRRGRSQALVGKGEPPAGSREGPGPPGEIVAPREPVTVQARHTRHEARRDSRAQRGLIREGAVHPMVRGDDLGRGRTHSVRRGGRTRGVLEGAGRGQKGHHEQRSEDGRELHPTGHRKTRRGRRPDWHDPGHREYSGRLGRQGVGHGSLAPA